MEKAEVIRVLLVDDDEDEYVLTRDRLVNAEGTHFDLDWVDAYDEALEAMQRRRYDVCLLDCRLGERDGLELLRIARSGGCKAPVIMLTGQGDRAVDLAAMEAGAADYLDKGTLTAPLLERSIRYALERERTQGALRQRSRALDLLNRVGRELTATLDQKHVAERLPQATAEVVDAEAALVWLPDAEREGWLACRAAFYQGRRRAATNWRLGPGEGVVGQVALSGKSALIPSSLSGFHGQRGRDGRTGAPTPARLAVPLRVGETVIGVLETVDKRHGEFDADDLSLLETLAAAAAIALDNARLIQSLRQHAAELQARTEELDAFAYTVAHDLKEPLGHVLGFAEILEQDYSSLPEQDLRRSLRTIARSSNKMANIINELLLLAGLRREAPEMMPVDMATAVDGALGRLAYVIEEHQAEVILPASWPVALGHGPWIEEVWVNYLSNALKYGGQPPRIELGFDEGSPSGGPAGSRGPSRTNGNVRYWVRDNGRGLTPEDQARLFTPFTRLEQVSARGHGLGLSIARRIVERMGGQVGVASVEGQGSIFSFTLSADRGDGGQGVSATTTPDVLTCTQVCGPGVVMAAPPPAERPVSPY